VLPTVDEAARPFMEWLAPTAIYGSAAPIAESEPRATWHDLTGDQQTRRGAASTRLRGAAPRPRPDRDYAQPLDVEALAGSARLKMKTR
jgi:hypothetical protein